jgi:ethanolamine ammonia-lyase small subunit
LDTPQFTEEQVLHTEKIARARIHVERAIQRMKTFRILNFLPYNLLRHADAILQVIGGLTNLKNPLIKEVEEKYSDQSEQSESET